ncbi:MAG: pyridoxal phosphate-dependent aminotransferase [Candidatus Micrarchaeota archaeon]|nr:pyridoxal phosphate-dependent aminotransferase [Candidatus Micrarchaeota archaeon]
MGTFSRASAFAGDSNLKEDHVADMLTEEGKRVIRLNRGDPTVYFPTDRYMIEAYVKALKAGRTGYSNVKGVLGLREAIARRYFRRYNVSYDADDIIITNGVSEGLAMLNAALIDANDRAVIFRPYYTLYYPGIKTRGGVPVIERYMEKDGWSVDLDGLRKSLKGSRKRSKYLLITNPNNPTGTVLGEKVLKEIVEIAKDHDLILISDEIYDEIVFNGAKFTSMSRLAKGVPHVILNGASKCLDATGFRIGFMIIPGNDRISRELRDIVTGFARLRICANTTAQYAVAEGLNRNAEHERASRAMANEIGRRADYMARKVNGSGYMDVVRPQGAYYIFPRVDTNAFGMKDDLEFVDRLLKEEGVELTGGSSFGEKEHLRIVTLAPKDILELAINRITAFCKRHSK